MASGATSIDGGDGNDAIVDVRGPTDGAVAIHGGAGDDFIAVTTKSPVAGNTVATLEGGAGNDEIHGDGVNPSVALFSGNSADYKITAMSDGQDAHVDGVANEQLYVTVADSVSGRDGTDKVFLSVGHLQFADATVDLASYFPTVGTAGADSIVGTDASAVIVGHAGDDTLVGGAGNDTIVGGTGNDVIDGGSGTNTASYQDSLDVVRVDLAVSGPQDTYSAGTDTLSHVQNLTGGAGADMLQGDASANVIDGGAGNDWINGRGGADTMIGGTGDDQFFVDDKGDVVVERPDEGNDRVESTISYTLPDYVEQLTLSGSSANTALDGTGNASDNMIWGGAGPNHLRGLAGDDYLDGGAGNDTLEGGPGHDRLYGGDGVDHAVYAGSLADLSITPNADGTYTVTSKIDSSDVDTISSIEFIDFADAVVTLDTTGDAATVFRLYQAAFGRTPDVGGLGYQLAAFHNGASLTELAEHFMASPEFQSKYPNLDDTAFVTQLYANVLHRDPDAAGLAFHLANLQGGESRATLLAAFSQSAENQANVAATTAGGIAYVPTMLGSSAGETFHVDAGLNAIDGGDGIDTGVFDGNRGDYIVSADGNSIKVTGADGTHLLTNVERLAFADGKVAFDTSGDAGQVYRLYQAAFDRAPDEAGLGYQINARDGGLSLVQVAANVIASPEFTSRYSSLDDSAFVTQLYRNVLHRDPDADGLAFHVDRLAHGVSRAEVLANFSESPENQAALIGTISHGMDYSS